MLEEKQIGINHKRQQILIFLLYPVCLFAFMAIGFLLFSKNEPVDSFLHRSELFYIRLIWFEIVFSIGWFAGFIEPVRNLLNHRQQIGGVFLAIASSVLNATVLSIVVLFISIFFPRSRFYDNLPIVLQICIYLFCIIKIVCLRYAQSFQVDGLNVVPSNIKNPEQLLAMLTICEQQPIIIDKFSVAVKRIREKIKYSLPKTGKIAYSDSYKNLASLVEKFYDNLMEGNYDDISSDLLLIEKNIVCVIADCKK